MRVGSVGSCMCRSCGIARVLGHGYRVIFAYLSCAGCLCVCLGPVESCVRVEFRVYLRAIAVWRNICWSYVFVVFRRGL